MRSRAIHSCSFAFMFTSILLMPLLGSVSGLDAVHQPNRDDIPASYDLRDVDGNSYVTAIRSQEGGTCWAHAAMASMESNLLMTGNWSSGGDNGEPNLAEYHLDWWNGFNNFSNLDRDPPEGGDLWVHYGGDFLMTAAYLSRGDGAVRDIDSPSKKDPSNLWSPTYHYFRPRQIEWYTIGENLENIDTIKGAIMDHGAIGTCMYASGAFMEQTNFTFYQPPTDHNLPNHAIAIIGWDDNKITQAPMDGAWICKNSWGSDTLLDGYFWISYHDKWACRDPYMGTVSFQDVEFSGFDRAYFHDYHGWRETFEVSDEGFNRFVARRDESLESVSFFTTEDDVDVTMKVFDSFEDGILKGELSAVSTHEDHMGLHTLDLPEIVDLEEGDDFYIYQGVSSGGLAVDMTSQVPLLLDGTRSDPWVVSRSDADQSFYHEDGIWKDLYGWNETSNLCMKGLVSIMHITDPDPGALLGYNGTIAGWATNSVYRVEVSIDGGPFELADGRAEWEYRIGTDITGYGPHTAEVRVFYGRLHEDREISFFLDDEPPSLEVTAAGLQGDDGWYLGDITMNLSAADDISGVGGIFYELDENSSETYQGDITITGDGTHHVKYGSVDRVGNIGEKEEMELHIDTAAPVTTHELVGGEGKERWYDTEVTLALSATDETSGVRIVQYRVNGEAWLNFSHPVEFNLSGRYTVDYRSRDIAGNVETDKHISFSVDIKAPVTRLTITGEKGNNEWYTSNVTIDITADDGHSGIDEIRYRFFENRWRTYTEGIELSGEGEFIFGYYSTDVCGNDEEKRIVIFALDRTPPITKMQMEGREGAEGWFLDTVMFTLKGSDPLSGFHHIAYRLDGGDWHEYENVIEVRVNGHHLLEYHSRDRAGNWEPIQKKEFKIDISPPDITLDSPTYNSTLRDENVTITWTADDIGSNISHITFSLDGGEEIILSADARNHTVLFLEEGNHSFSISIFDLAGMKTTKGGAFKVNLTVVPVIMEQPDQSDDENGPSPWYLLSFVPILLIVGTITVAIFMKRKRSHDPMSSGKP